MNTVREILVDEMNRILNALCNYLNDVDFELPVITPFHNSLIIGGCSFVGGIVGGRLGLVIGNYILFER